MKLNKGNKIGKRTLGIVTAAAVGLSVCVPVFAADAVQQAAEETKTDAQKEESQRVPIFWNPAQKQESTKQKDDKKKSAEEAEEPGYSEENAVSTFDAALKLLKAEKEEDNAPLLILCGDAELTKEQKDSLKKQKVESMTLEAWAKLLKEEEEQAKAAAETEATVTPTPGTEETVTPTPGTEETVTPTPGTEETVTLTPGTGEAVTPTPGTEEGVTPTPGTDGTATPTPGTEETVTPTPGTEETVTPTPGTEETVTPTPGTEETVTPTPGTEETVTPTPGTEETEPPEAPEKSDSSAEEESVVDKVTNILSTAFANTALNVTFETNALSLASLETAAAAEEEPSAVTAAVTDTSQETVTAVENQTETQSESAGADLLAVSQVRTLLRALPGRDLVGHGTTNRGTTTSSQSSSKSSQSSSSSASSSKASNQKDTVISLPVNTGDTVQMLPFVLSGACAIGAAAVTANKWSLTRRRQRDCAGYALEMEAFRKACDPNE